MLADVMMDTDSAVNRRRREIEAQDPNERCKQQACVAFIAERFEFADPKTMKKKTTGHELHPRKLPGGSEEDFDRAKGEEWAKLMRGPRMREVN